MATRFQFRRANAAAWTGSNPTLAAGELGFELDTGKFKIGNGSSAWNSLAYAATNIIASYPVDYNSSTYAISLLYGTGLTVNGSNQLVPDFGTTSGKVAQGNDSRFTDARTPTAHKTSHSTGGTDALAPSDIGAVPTTRTLTGTAPVTIGGVSGTGQALSSDLTIAANAASTSAAGVVQLSDSTSTTSSILAATPTAVKAAYDLANNAVPQSAVGSTVASLSSGKIPSSQIPAIAITDTFVVSSQSAMLALTAEVGDVAIRTDLSKSFILQGSDSTVLANWKELLTPADAVTSVDGLTGVVSLTNSYAAKTHATTHGSAGSDPVTIANTQVTGLGSSSTKDVAATGDASSTQVVLGSDTRLTDARTPTSHKSTHATGGTDALAPSDIGAVASSSLGTNVQTFLTTPSSQNLIDAVTGETGTGALVFGTSPTLVTPSLGTPTSLTLSNATGLPISGINGLGTGVGTWLATPSSSNLYTAVTDRTGTGGGLVFASSPSLSSPTLTTPAITSAGFTLAGSSSGTTTVVTSSAGSGTVTIPSGTQTLATQGGQETLTNKTLAQPTIDNIKMGWSTTATANGTTTLTSTSNYRQFFTGTLAQTIVLPVSITGLAFEIHNNSTGTLTVNPSGGTPSVVTIEGGKSYLITAISDTGTTAAAWDADITGATNGTGTGALVFGTSPTLSSPTLGAANATTINSTIIPSSATLVSSAGPSVLGTVQTFTTTGTSNDVPLSTTTTVFKYTGASAATITGFSGAAGVQPVTGRTVIVQNASSTTVTLSHNLSSVSTNRFTLPASSDITLNLNESVMLIYDGSFWRTTSRSVTPIDATYITLSSDATLTNERVLGAGTYTTISSTATTVAVNVNGTTAATADTVAVRDSVANLVASNLQPNVSTLATTGTVNIDFAGDGFRTQAALTGNIVYTASNYAAGRSITIKVINGATQRTLTFPTGWIFLNGSKPTVILASKTAVLTVTCFGTLEADCVAAWSSN